MADTLSLEIRAGIQWLHEQSLELSTLVDAARLDYQRGLADGAGPDEADVLWHDSRTLAMGADDDLDLTDLPRALAGGTLSLAMARLKALLIHNAATDDGEDLVLDSSVADGLLTPFAGSATSKLVIPPDSPLLLVHRGAGWAIAPGTAHVLRISNAGSASIDYRIVLVGTSE